ncbi:lipase family protein [Nocardia tengchongensis]|uniref:lipase family protein n=1 Tax=Nocardia tengchongensis TaxID=2055889 RepID=UPI00369717E0
MISRLAAASALAVATAASAGPVAAEQPPVVTVSVVPDQDPFYAPPPDIDALGSGQVVAGREISTTLPVPVRGWQVSYRTNDSHGNAELGITTLLVPTAPWTGPGSRPAVSEQIPEDSTGTRCAPSYGIGTGTLQSGDQISAMLAEGWAVAVPDFEGPKSAFLTGPQSGHAILDGVRAAGGFTPAGLGRDTRWALDGYSGGAAATGWAAELQPTYAPELAFAGAAIGGVPASLPAVMTNVDGGVFSGFLVGVLVSYQREFPEARIDELLNERGRADTAAAADLCVIELLIRYPFWRLAAATADRYRDDTRLTEALQRNSLGAHAPAMPILNYQSDADEVVPVAQADDLVAAWRRGGTTVVTIRDPQGEHAQEASQRQATAQQFLREWLAVGGPVVDADLNRPVGQGQ